MNKFKKWLKSKTGKYVVTGLAVVLVVGLVLIAVLTGGDQGLTGTAGLPAGEFPAPADGTTCLPSCEVNDGKFFLISNLDMATFAGSKVVVWISVPGQYKTFDLSIFDGDSGLDNTGALNMVMGNWDDGISPATYTLYADPLKDGSGTQVVGSWDGNATPMPNNDWWTITIDTEAEAQGVSRNYFYRLEVTQPLVGNGGNAFKLRSNAYLSAGRELLVNSDFALVGAFSTISDLRILYPQAKNVINLGTSTYTGDWAFSFYVPEDQDTLELWDGDFDRGTTTNPDVEDTDDPNTDGIPEWSGPFAIAEGEGGQGKPADNSRSSMYKRDPAVIYELINPDGTPLYVNSNPSGTEEWERFVIGTADSVIDPDMTIDEIQPGFYTIHISGLDLHNLVFFRTNFEICDKEDGCGPREWPEGNCPRTIGYWKNNVKKIYIQNKTTGIQESKASLDWALRNVALASPIFRHGINVKAPVAIADPTPLTPAEANAILQKTAGNTMLDRALQQNLATWLNMATGKIGPTTKVSIDVPSGTYYGSLMGALREAEDIILNGGNIERAKDIADLINNAQINVDPNDVLACTQYANVIPPADQPPAYDDMPEAPVPDEPAPPAPPADEVCTDAGTTLAQDFTILAVNPEACLGEQNGLLFHGTSLTEVSGNAFSNGCLRSVGTHTVQISDGQAEYVLENFGDMTLISPEPVQVTDPINDWQLAAPDCSDPNAIQMDGKDFKKEILLAPGLYCIMGDVTVNAGDTLIGTGVTLYFIDGGLHINGDALVNLTAPYGVASDVAPALSGVLIYAPGENGGGQPIQINGNEDSTFQGIVYAPGSELELLGTGVTHACGQFIGWDVRVGGTADLLIGCDGGIPVCEP